MLDQQLHQVGGVQMQGIALPSTKLGGFKMATVHLRAWSYIAETMAVLMGSTMDL